MINNSQPGPGDGAYFAASTSFILLIGRTAQAMRKCFCGRSPNQGIGIEKGELRATGVSAGRTKGAGVTGSENGPYG